MKQWNVQIDESPVKVTGQQLKIGNFVMAKNKDGKRNEFSAEPAKQKDNDRLIQTEMYSQKPMKKWAFMYNRKDKKAAEQFLSEFKQCSKTYRFDVAPPKKFELNNDQEWENEIRKFPNPKSINMIV